MPSTWLSRLFFAFAAVVATVALMSGTACTRWGQPGPVPPSLTPLSSLYVNPTSGSDATGNGSATKPYKTLTKAIDVLVMAKSVSSAVTINLANGDYAASNGETFPIVVPALAPAPKISIVGTNFGGGPKNGTFIDGSGEDTLFERLVNAPPRSAYTTLEIAAGADVVSATDIYVGASKLKLPSSRAAYASVDVMGTFSAGPPAGFGAGIFSSSPNVSGVLVAGGTFNCSSCRIQGNDFGVGALSVPLATSSPSNTTPSISLTHANGDSTIAAKVADILTDGSANVTASGETFERAQYAFVDALHPVVSVPVRGAIDFGGGANSSPGGNGFIGARATEIYIVRRNEVVVALDDTWNPAQQRANRSGLYTKKITFGAGANGRNVRIQRGSAGSTVTVGPAPVPTPTPSASPSSSPSSSPSP
jgi:hypothetical protein